MTDWIRFHAPKRRGIVLHAAVLLGLTASIAGMLSLASQSPPGLLVVVLLILSVIAGFLFPIFFYRLYALLRSEYSLDREGLRLRWGLRQIDLPHDQIVDVALAEELHAPPDSPRWQWPGSVMGIIQDGELGAVEYMASEKEGHVLLGTSKGIFVISPENPAEFLAVYHREAERGSIVEMKARSVVPSFIFNEAWADPSVRRLLIAGASLAAALLLLVGILAPGLESVPLGFAPTGGPLEEVPASQLFLLPAIHLVFALASFLLGLILYRESENALIAKLVWGSTLFVGFLFLVAILISAFS
jgi:hypothetical protein